MYRPKLYSYLTRTYNGLVEVFGQAAACYQEQASHRTVEVLLKEPKLVKRQKSVIERYHVIVEKIGGGVV